MLLLLIVYIIIIVLRNSWNYNINIEYKYNIILESHKYERLITSCLSSYMQQNVFSNLTN